MSKDSASRVAIDQLVKMLKKHLPEAADELDIARLLVSDDESDRRKLFETQTGRDADTNEPLKAA